MCQSTEGRDCAAPWVMWGSVQGRQVFVCTVVFLAGSCLLWLLLERTSEDKVGKDRVYSPVNNVLMSMKLYLVCSKC